MLLRQNQGGAICQRCRAWNQTCIILRKEEDLAEIIFISFVPLYGRIPWRRAWQPTPVFLPGESPWTEEPGGLQPMGLQRVRHYQEFKHSIAHERITMLDFLCPAQPSLNKKQRQAPRFPSFHKLHCWGHVSIWSVVRYRGTWKQGPRPRGSRLYMDKFSQRYLTLGFPELTVPVSQIAYGLKSLFQNNSCKEPRQSRLCSNLYQFQSLRRLRFPAQGRNITRGDASPYRPLKGSLLPT